MKGGAVMDDKIYPDKCPLFDICLDNLAGEDFKECSHGKNQCNKSQKVLIGLLNDILAELREPGAKGK